MWKYGSPGKFSNNPEFFSALYLILSIAGCDTKSPHLTHSSSPLLALIPIKEKKRKKETIKNCCISIFDSRKGKN